ncbi:MAG: hypothetical protein J6M25_08755 [Prevotella sp.]|nr:hypothetical protein [Prevotella sp.]
MAKNSKWHDDYWLMLMQIYLKKPAGMKPLYYRDMVELSLELHIAPQALQARMQQIARLDTPRIERIWQTYSKAPQRLQRAVALLRKMNGFGAADEFYDGVEVQETFEKDFRPLPGDDRFTPAQLIMVLDLYFRLTPATMVALTPEVQELARLLKHKAAEVVEVLDVFQLCDPYLNRTEVTFSPLLLPCQQVWQRFGNQDPAVLADFATQLKEYFR